MTKPVAIEKPPETAPTPQIIETPAVITAATKPAETEADAVPSLTKAETAAVNHELATPTVPVAQLETTPLDTQPVVANYEQSRDLLLTVPSEDDATPQTQTTESASSSGPEAKVPVVNIYESTPALVEQSNAAPTEAIDEVTDSESDSEMEISDADLETIISQWKSELFEPAAIEDTDQAELNLTNTELTLPAESETIEIVPPALVAITTQIADRIENLEPETATEVHELLGELLQQIEEIQQLVENSDNEPASTAMEASLELDQVTPDQPSDIIPSMLIAEAPLLPTDELAPADTIALEATLTQLCRSLGLDYEPQEIKILVHQLLTTEPRHRHEQADSDTSLDWGTRESLQWFTSQLRTMRRQTNVWHGLIGRVGRSALASMSSLLQPA